MGRPRLLLALAAAFLGAIAAGCSTPGDDPGPPLAVEPAAIYAQMCARCHGSDGRGDPAMKKTMPVRDFSDPVFQARAASSTEEIAGLIMSGRNQMPSFGGLLSPPKIQALSGFVRRLGRAPAAAAPAAAAPAAAAPAAAASRTAPAVAAPAAAAPAAKPAP